MHAYSPSMTSGSLLSQLLDASERNTKLSGDELRLAAAAVARRAASDGLLVASADDAGERIIGAALALAELELLNRTRRADGCAVLLVAGHIAGHYDVERTAGILRSLGAAHVQAMVMSAPTLSAAGCESVEIIGQRSRAALVA